MIEFIFGVATSLTASAIDRRLAKKLNFSDRKKVSAKIDEISIAVIEPLVSYLEQEKVPEVSATGMVETARPIVEWLITNPDFSFSRGLDAEIITRNLIDEKLDSIKCGHRAEYPAAFETILRALVDLVTKTPDAFESWEKTSFQTIFKEIESIKSTLSAVYDAMKMVSHNRPEDDASFGKILNFKATTSALKTSIHGLRQSPIPQAELDSLFVFPSIEKQMDLEIDGVHISELVEEFDEDEGGELEYELESNFIRTFEEFLEFAIEKVNLVIQGPAGSGKTTFSNWIGSKLLSSRKSIFPIILPLRQIVKSGSFPNLREAFEGSTSSVFKDLISPESVATWAEDGRILIIFEGYDEVSESERDAVLEWIMAMRTAHASLTTIITSRPLSTDHIERLTNVGWNRSALLPFNTDQVVTYIERFQKHGPNIQTGAKPRSPEDLAAAWRSDSTLKPLTGNPLLLSTLLVVHHMDGELPDDRAKLYDRYIDGMLGLWELNKDLTKPAVSLTKEQKKKILELIAVNMISTETDAASEDDVSNWINSFLKKEKIHYRARDILDHLRERSGLLVGPGQYTFAHKSIGEFLVSRSCNDGIQVDTKGTRFDRLLLLKNCTKDRWINVIFLWAGVAAISEVQDFISTLIDRKEFSLSAGLLIERRKFLEPAWLEQQFWKWVELSDEFDNGEQEEKSFYHLTAPAKSLLPTPSNLYIQNISSISNNFASESDLIYKFSQERIVNIDHWPDYHINFTPARWWMFLRLSSDESKIFEKCPNSFSTESRTYQIIKYLNSEYKNPQIINSKIKSLNDTSNLNTSEAEVLMCLEFYVDYKAISPKVSLGGTSAARKVLQHKIEKLENCGVIDRALSYTLDRLGSKFFSILDEEYGESFFFSHAVSSSKDHPKLLIDHLNDAIKKESEFETIEKLDSLVSNILNSPLCKSVS